MKSFVFAFGRMNPPTKGHRALVEKVLEEASFKGCEYGVYLSHSQKTPERDPLTFSDKYIYASKSFPDVLISEDNEMKTAFIVLEKLIENGYDDITFVAGSDQFITGGLANKMFNWVDEKDLKITFTNVAVNRAKGSAKNISATLAKEAVANKNFMKFSKIVSSDLEMKDKRELFLKVKQGMLKDAIK